MEFFMAQNYSCCISRESASCWLPRLTLGQKVNNATKYVTFDETEEETHQGREAETEVVSCKRAPLQRPYVGY